ncbi:hypothetical protein GCM10025868_26200 [Angustibacter aerolatus]|uniref:RNA polymerase sigma factor 70 region 4 type 2 domain-containing protein n=1 Tax=Angustibacter aerolatus TaxID=1162965 RepID=A0ABQ6JKQ8_9ACTN|nr:hypothetical protein GCM10025868_26200 [Angustibacter aerolatus]
MPDRPAAWLHTAARRNAVDRLRRDARLRDRLPSLDAWALGGAPAPEPVDGAPGAGPGDDVRLGLLFGCCHPALAPQARLALTLRAVLGLTVAQIARATFEPEPTVAQRISRAKRKVGAAGIPVRIPDVDEPARTARRRAHRGRHRVQRGVPRERRPDPRRPRPRGRRHLAGRRRRDRAAARARGARAARAAAAAPGPPRRALRRRPHRAARRPAARACGGTTRSPRRCG